MQLFSKYQELENVKKDRMNNKHNEFAKLSKTHTETVRLQKFSNYALRVSESAPEILGLDTVKQYTGYLMWKTWASISSTGSSSRETTQKMTLLSCG